MNEQHGKVWRKSGSLTAPERERERVSEQEPDEHERTYTLMPILRENKRQELGAPDQGNDEKPVKKENSGDPYARAAGRKDVGTQEGQSESGTAKHSPEQLSKKNQFESISFYHSFKRPLRCCCQHLLLTRHTLRRCAEKC